MSEQFEVKSQDNTIEFFNRFMSHVNVSKETTLTIDPNELGDCWEWSGATLPSGYGVMEYDGKTRYSHRVMYAMTHGPIPANMCICHCCDNPKCVNPLHLFLATQKANMEDMMQKNRGNKAKGEDHGKAKLSNQTVAEIKAALDRDRYHGQIKDLAAKHNVSEAHMSNIANGKRRAS